jgi:hypothetical protein
MQHIWEKYANKSIVQENEYRDIIYRVDLYNGNSEMLLMDDDVAEDLRNMQGPNRGGALVWMGEEYMYLKPHNTY